MLMPVPVKVIFFLLICIITLGFVAIFCWYLQYSSEHWRTVYAESSITNILSPCTLPHGGGFNSWKTGVVTVMRPEISRNCSLLFKGNADEMTRVRKQNENWNGSRDSKDFFEWSLSSNCTRIRDEFLDNFYVSREEIRFPLAFSLSIHDNPRQVVRLLKVIYRPHNLYCIHYDLKTSSRFKKVFDNIAKCVHNIFIPSKIIKVNWGDHTILDAQLNCIADLYDARLRVEWMYLITLCGKELPLRTNSEIVKVLKPLNKTSALIHFDLPAEDRWRVKVRSYSDGKGGIIQTRRKLGAIPHKLKIYKSLAYFGLTPEFVDFILHDSKATDLLWFMHKGVSSAEEHFYSTLFAIPGVPGGYKEEVADLIPRVISAIWLHKSSWEQYCSGWVIHWICIVSSGDLQRLTKFMRVDTDPHLHKQGAMFHNKYFMERDHTVMDCVEEQLVNRNKQEYRRDCIRYMSHTTQLLV